MPDLTAESLISHMQVSAETAAAGTGADENHGLGESPMKWSMPPSKPGYQPVSVNKAKEALKNAEKKSRRYGKWPRSWFRNQGRIDQILFGAVKHLIRLAVKFDAGLRKHEKSIRGLVPKVGILQLSAMDLQREFMRLSSRVDLLEGQVRQYRSQVQHQRQLIESLGQDSESLEDKVGKLTADLDRLKRECRSVPVKAASIEAGAPGALTHHARFDRLYLEFEDQFRGSEELVARRLQNYLPYLERACAVSRPLVALDIGCGRGEWLQLLKKQGVVARGVDSNVGMVAHSVAQGLDVTCGNGLEYLRQQPAQSLGLVTAFHVVEHLSSDDLLVLLEEAARVLVPGGMAIFETPNPANVTVSTFSFYLDPSHRHPLPAPLLKFLCHAAGFGGTEVLELHACPSEVQVPEEGSPVLAGRFNQLFYGPQDYAVIAWTPA